MSITKNNIDSMVSALLLARNSGVPELAPDLGSVEDAYRVQAAVAGKVGPVGGFKVANRADQPKIMAPIFAQDISASTSRIACPSDEDIGIELEIGFRVDGPLPNRGATNRAEQIASCISLVPAIEIVRTRIAGDASPLMKLADNQINGGLIVGDAISDWRGVNVRSVNAQLRIGDDAVFDGPAEVPGGDAFGNFLVLEEMVGNHCGGLRPGHLVITGSLNGLPYIRPGKSIHGEISGIGSVSFELAIAR